MLTYRVTAARVDKHGSVASAKTSQIALDTDRAGREDAFNPVELLLAALAACIIKGIERVAPMIKFEFDAIKIDLDAERQDTPPKLTRIRYNLAVRTDESDQRLDLLHANVRKYGTISTRWRAQRNSRGKSGVSTKPRLSGDGRLAYLTRHCSARPV